MRARAGSTVATPTMFVEPRDEMPFQIRFAPEGKNMSGFLLVNQDSSDGPIEAIVDGVVRSGATGSSQSVLQPVFDGANFRMNMSNRPAKVIPTGRFFGIKNDVNVHVWKFKEDFTLQSVANDTTYLKKTFMFSGFLIVNLRNGEGQGYHSVHVWDKRHVLQGALSACSEEDGISSMCIPVNKAENYMLSCLTGKEHVEYKPDVYFVPFYVKFLEDLKPKPNYVGLAKTDGFMVVKLRVTSPKTTATVKVFNHAHPDHVNSGAAAALMATTIVTLDPRSQIERGYERTITVPIRSNTFYKVHFEATGAAKVDASFYPVELH